MNPGALAGLGAEVGAPLPASAPTWRLHIAGPDDVHDYADELEALRAANAINQAYLADRARNPGNEVLFVATVERIATDGLTNEVSS